jgi:hypothetical protein
MNLRAQRCLLIVLAVSAAYVGGWASLAPHSFYGSFPGLGRHWVAADGPYNEHLVRDVGGLYLALLAISAWAPLRPDRDVVRVAGLAWALFSVPHLAYHAGHLHHFGTADQIGNLVTLGASAILGMALLIPLRRQTNAPAPAAAG